MSPTGTEQFMAMARSAVTDGTLVKLTLGKPAGPDPTLRNLFVRPVTLKSGPRLAFVWRHATRDITKNHAPSEGLALIEDLVGRDFLDAHLFTRAAQAQLETGPGKAVLRVVQAQGTRSGEPGNDRQKQRVIAADVPWLRSLGVTDLQGRPVAAMTDKFRQIQRFAEILSHLVKEAPLPADRPLSVYDMGCGKGYLTFAASELLGERARVTGIEVRADLVRLCNDVAAAAGLGGRLAFAQGAISDQRIEAADILIALHACDTATDDALAKAVAAGASLIVVAPCCQKEVRPQLKAPPVLAPALRHGIFLERQAEFATDALRALLLEWCGYRTRVFEFVSGEHTAKNTMIAAVRTGPRDPQAAESVRRFAAFYGIGHQALATHLGFNLE